MEYPVRDRAFNDAEFELMRLGLSTFRDGSGQFIKSLRVYMPDYLDFERVTALVTNGVTSEDKGVFDVLVPVKVGLPFGISCKMTAMQPATSRASFMELSNSHAKFAEEFDRLGIDWRSQPELAGPAVVNLVGSWHHALHRTVDLAGSRYLVLAHNTLWTEFQLLCFPLDLTLADPVKDVEWINEGRNGTSNTVAGYIDVSGRPHRLWQLYQNSGGQLKYYPLLAWADWITPRFTLEEPPAHDLAHKVAEYFPDLWPHD